MKAVLFLSRVTFILNILFVISVMGYYRLFTLHNNYVTGFITTTGYGLALIVNSILQTTLAVRALRGYSNRDIPSWLFNVNFILFIFQLIFFFLT